MAYEPRTNSIVLFGGTLHPSENENEVPINETWIYSVARNAWTQVFPEDAPSPRAWHVMSRTDGPVMLFGGGPSRLAYTNETYLYDSRANEWQLVAGGAQSAGHRAYVSAAASAGSMRDRQRSREGQRSHQ
jgi:hypothetical protein